MATRNYNIVITRPCTDAPDRFIAESSFGSGISMDRLCDMLKAISGAKCSESLGVAKFDFKGKTLILYRSGRIDLRKVMGKEDALATMNEIREVFCQVFEDGGQ